MHVVASAFHYASEVAASHHSLIWFRDLGARSIRGPSGAFKFLNDLFLSLWVPQMTTFTRQQPQRRLGRQNGTTFWREMVETLQEQRLAVQEWAQPKDIFTWRYVGMSLTESQTKAARPVTMRVFTLSPASGLTSQYPSRHAEMFRTSCTRAALVVDELARLVAST